MVKRIYLDFDGVFHIYPKSVYKNNVLRNFKPTEIVGTIVPGAIGFLEDLLFKIVDTDYEVNIFSGRSFSWGGRTAMKNWLIEQGLLKDLVKYIKFPLIKKPVHVIMDDRAISFTGTFPEIKELLNFKPWTYRGGKK